MDVRQSKSLPVDYTSLFRHRRRSRSSSPPTRDQSEIPAQLSAFFKRKYQQGNEPEEYDSLHQGPHLTVASADGTEFWADAESQEFRSAAARSLYRAMQGQHAAHGGKILDGHLDQILGAVETNVKVNEVRALKYVTIARKKWEVESIRPDVEDCEGGTRHAMGKFKKLVTDWVYKHFG